MGAGRNSKEGEGKKSKEFKASQKAYCRAFTSAYLQIEERNRKREKERRMMISGKITIADFLDGYFASKKEARREARAVVRDLSTAYGLGDHTQEAGTLIAEALRAHIDPMRIVALVKSDPNFALSELEKAVEYAKNGLHGTIRRLRASRLNALGENDYVEY